MPALFMFLNDCEKMPVGVKLKTSVFNQIDNAELKCFNTKTEQKAFCSSLKTSLTIRGNLNGSAFLLFMLLFSNSVNDAAILK